MSNVNLKITNSLKHFEQTPRVESTHTPKEKAKLAKAAQDFESMMTAMMLKSMTKTTGGMFGENSFGGDYFDSIFETEIASFISENNSLGLANMIYKKIMGEDLDMNKIKSELKSKGIEKIELNPDDNSPAITPSDRAINRLKNFDEMINHASNSFKIDENLIRSVILTESAANAKAISKAKAKGLMQLMDSTAAEMKVKNIWDPKQNINGGTKYLAKMFRQFNGDLDLTLAAYNAGPGNVEKYNGVPPFEETKNYINRVKGYLKYWEQSI
ncbi:MAG: transglycosylase SLT domain-containing protein [Melioribacteraceae bacterium]|nr:transglycosylase SLT domain-containing protein [Melioribacteraceae bacterium]